MKVDVAVLIAGFTLQLFVVIAGIIYAAGQIKAKLDEERKHLDRVSTKMDALMQEAANAKTILWAKITDVEIWARDTFVRRDSFFAVTKDLKEGFEKGFEKLEKKIDDLGGKE